jgi:apolipoprotein N-acyltransferase
MDPVLSPGLGDRVSRHRIAAGVSSGLLLWTSFPPAEWHWLAWVALVPLFWLVTLPEAILKSYLAAWCGGLLFWLLALEWVRLSDPSAWLGWILMALIFSITWPAFLALTRWGKFRLGIPLIVTAPIVWVGLEFVRAYFMTGLPWYYLAHSQFRRLFVIQVADLTGSLGISALVALVNAFLVDLLSLPLLARTKKGVRLTRAQNLRLCLVTILLGSSLCYGAFRLSTASFHDGPELALIQSNLPQRHKMRGDPAQIVDRFVALVDRAARARVRPDLIVWPETAYPYGFIALNQTVDNAVLDRQIRSLGVKISAVDWLDRKEVIAEQLHRWTDRIGIPMLVGSTLYDHHPLFVEKFNAAILFRPGAESYEVYRKMHLVPFGEYVPFVDAFPWLAGLTPYERDRVPRLSFGHDPVLFSLGEYRVAVSICFEDTVSRVIDRFFEIGDDGHDPDVLVNLSNDGWFHDSSELDMHLAIGVFRAVEHRVPFARAVNTGLSALVDGNGEIRATLPKSTEGVLSVTVPLDDRRSFYSRTGDWVGLSCLAVTIGLVPLGVIRKARK